jgi:phage antirepressor YoqD-like protein
MSFKKAYIKAFNEMEAKLRSTALPVSYKDALKALIVEIEAKEALEAKNAVLQLAADKYEGQTDTIELYKIGEIAEEFGISAVALNKFLHDQRIQYKPNGSDVWRLYTEHSAYNYAFPKLVTLDNGFTKPMLFWTAKGRDFIHDVVEKAQPHWYA